jgi:peroxiredoxin Q/BCP
VDETFWEPGIGTFLARTGRMAKLAAGNKAPNFNLRDQDGRKVKLSDFKGRKLLVYFYPRADTPGCTRQSCSVGESLPDLKRLGIDAVGISPDRPEAQKKFDEKYGLGFPLLSDEGSTVARAWGAWGTKTSFGKKKEGIIRSSFVVGENAKVVAAFYRVKPEDTVPRALRALGE